MPNSAYLWSFHYPCSNSSHDLRMYRNFRAISRGLYVVFEPAEGRCGLYANFEEKNELPHGAKSDTVFSGISTAAVYQSHPRFST